MSAEILRLLLIDDDALLRDRVLTPRLRQFGFEVMAIGHVGEMAQAIERRKPDIVLLDIGLPDHDGFEVSRTLRAQFSDIGIVMLTGRSETSDRVRGLSEGADAYLSKPVEIDVLVATLHSVARRLKSPSNPPAPAGTWKLDSDDWLLLSPSGGRVILSKTERLLLEELMKQPNQVVVRDILRYICVRSTSAGFSDPSPAPKGARRHRRATPPERGSRAGLLAGGELTRFHRIRMPPGCGGKDACQQRRRGKRFRQALAINILRASG